MVAQVRALIEQSEQALKLLAQQADKLAQKDFKITALTRELACYRRIRFSDLAAIEAELAPNGANDTPATADRLYFQ